MHKIYSRFRIKIPKYKFPKSNKSLFIKIVMIFVIAFFTVIFILNAVEPIFNELCKEKAKSIATIVSNKQATEVMKKYSYEELFSIERDNDGNIRMIKSNVIPMNEIISDVPNKIQEEINNMGRGNIEIALR